MAHEREMISQRTKAALAEAKRRGTRLGNPRIEEARVRAAAARRTPVEPDVLQLMRDLQMQGKGLREIARQLNRLNVRAGRRSLWYASTVRKAIAA
jgi:DNA invertase Pin-like site-specific DNA recombinase